MYSELGCSRGSFWYQVLVAVAWVEEMVCALHRVSDNMPERADDQPTDESPLDCRVRNSIVDKFSLHTYAGNYSMMIVLDLTRLEYRLRADVGVCDPEVSHAPEMENGDDFGGLVDILVGDLEVAGFLVVDHLVLEHLVVELVVGNPGVAVLAVIDLSGYHRVPEPECEASFVKYSANCTFVISLNDDKLLSIIHSS